MNTTVVIPIGPGHADLSFRAINSVETQTVKTRAVVKWDQDGRGAGWARNRGLEQVDTKYTMFLDADDWLEPNAIEIMENAMPDGYYVYSDWYQNHKVQQAPLCAFCMSEQYGIEAAHIITALVPTEWIREVGGFDEEMPVMEDTDLWVKLRYVGKHEGKRVAIPLVHYEPDGGRSRLIIDRIENGHPVFTALRETIRAQILERYQERGYTMGCCGEPAVASNKPTNAKVDGDVLVKTLWNGNRRIYGRYSGRLYRGGSGGRLWVAPGDLHQMRHLFKAVEA